MGPCRGGGGAVLRGGGRGGGNPPLARERARGARVPGEARGHHRGGAGEGGRGVSGAADGGGAPGRRSCLLLADARTARCPFQRVFRYGGMATAVCSGEHPATRGPRW